MSGDGPFPYPDDDPEHIRSLSRALAEISGGVTDTVGTFGTGSLALHAAWQSGAGDRSVTAVDDFAGKGGAIAHTVANAQGPLDDYANALVTARTAIDDLNHRWQQNQDAYAAALPEATADPAVALRLGDDAATERDGRSSALRAEHQTVMEALDRAAVTTGEALAQMATQVPPEGLVYRDGDDVVLRLGDGDDDVSVELGPGGTSITVLVNGVPRQIRLEGGQTLRIETAGGDDVVDIAPDLELGVRVDAGDGDDIVAGGSGADTFQGGRGNDVLIGGQGDDTLRGGDGDDRLLDALPFPLFPTTPGWVPFLRPVVWPRRGSGDDTFEGGAGDDVLDGGVGADRLHGGQDDDTLRGAAGDDLLHGDDGDDAMFGGDGDDTAHGGHHQDIIVGNRGKDTLHGDDGNDLVAGGEGHDVVFGDAGNDWLSGGEGADGVVSDPSDGIVAAGPQVRPEPVDVTPSAPGGEVSTCPVAGPVQFSDTYGAPRPGGRGHEGVDIFAPVGTPVLAPASGRVEHYDDSVGGLSYRLHADDGTYYYGTHLSAYENVGAGRVEAGTVLGYVGKTGNAATTPPHLHWEIHPGGKGTPAINPTDATEALCGG